MMSFAYPWVFLTLVLPFAVAFLAPPKREIRLAVRVPFMERLRLATGLQPSPGAVVPHPRAIQRWMLVLFWMLLVIALARPQWIAEPQTRVVPSRDLLIAVDLSGSMETEDLVDADGNRVDRLTAVKSVLDDFLTRRKGDRVGLIFFGSAPFIQVPFTEDLDVCRQLLAEARVGMAGPRTMLGDAIGLGLNVFDRSELEDRVLILLTDGNDTGSQIAPDRAASIAADRGVTIHTIAFGDPASLGEAMFDEDLLRDVAGRTGGEYFYAADQAELEGVYQRLDLIDTRELESISYRPRHDLFHWPLGVCGMLMILLQGVGAAITSRGSRGPVRTDAGSTSVADGSLGPVTVLALGTGISGFHFLRPAWLLCLLLAGIFVFIIARQSDANRVWSRLIDPDLLQALTVGRNRRRRFRPIWVLVPVILLLYLALAGPAWRQEASPFADDQASLVIVMEVSASMANRDVQPSRLERARQKIGDLVEARPGARTGLIAYSGSAHLVMPLTKDGSVIRSFAGEVSPAIMPLEGDDPMGAIRLAQRQLDESGQPGSILLVTDGLQFSDLEPMRTHVRAGGAPVHILAIADPANLDLGVLDSAARALKGTFTTVTPDETDITRLIRMVETRFQAAAPDDGGSRWRDEGYWLMIPLALVSLLWFRRGWVVEWAVLALLLPALIGTGDPPAQSGSVEGQLNASVLEDRIL
jgi:Mg-chelatase subunit ChlD